MNRYYDKIIDISNLAAKKRTLTPEAISVLKELAEAHMRRRETNDITVALEFIVQVVGDQAYLKAINDVLEILRRP